jgi:murein L,D-transpeptidase YafK
MKKYRPVGWKTLFVVSGLAVALAGCQDVLDSVENKVEYPLPKKLVNKMKANDQRVRAPIMIRIYKQEGMLEVWKARGNGRYAMVKEYEICKWSGTLGPKFKEGDRQAPEGFYDIRAHQMNPKSSYYLSFNMGFPNRYDRANGRTGSHLMIHGACSSAGCYSMTDEQVLEIYAFAREAFRGGQPSFQVQAYPFRMTAENMATHRNNKHYEYWQMLKIGYDHFELTKRPPKVNVCDRKYVFNQVTEDEEEFRASEICPPSATPQSLQLAYASYSRNYEKQFAEAVDDAIKKENKAKRKLANVPVTAAIPAAQSTPQQNVAVQQSVRVLAAPTTAAPVPSEIPVPATGTVTTTSAGTADTPAPARKTWWKVWKR